MALYPFVDCDRSWPILATTSVWWIGDVLVSGSHGVVLDEAAVVI